MAAKRRRKTKIHWNIGMIIFVVILVYILINVILFLGKKKLTVYKVTEDKITNTLSFTGIAIRDEELLKASQSGYITYYVEEGKRIKKSGTVFTVDKDQKVQDAFVSQVQQLEKNKKVIDDEEIQHKITDYQSVYSDHKFSTVYDLKYDLKNAILNLSEDSMKTVIEAVKQKLGDTSFETQKSTSSGVTQFYSDDFDGKNAKDITSKDFDQSQYREIGRAHV